MPEWIYYGNFALNLLIIPLVKILLDIRTGLIKLETQLQDHIEQDQRRLDRLERLQDEAR